MWKKILVPLDGSDLAELALPYAQELADAFNSELTLLYVGEASEEQYLHMYELYLEKMAVQTKKLVKRVSPVVISGKNPAEGIVKYTEKNDVRLIVMASHGSSGIIPWAKGGIASEVIDAIGVAVMMAMVCRPPQWAALNRRVAGDRKYELPDSIGFICVV